MVQLISESEVKQEMGEAFASFMLNPTVTWAKFILTDDRRNGNGQRIPKTEFANLIRSGIHMPVKMAIGEINQGHDDSKPLGTITHLKEIETPEGASAIVALAALWTDERPADVEFIKKRFAERKPIDVSWELMYQDETLNEEEGSIDLLGTVLQAATIVGNPAYQGRTPFLAVAAKKENASESDRPDQEITEEELKTVEELQAELAEAQTKLSEAQAQLEEKANALAEREAEVARLAEETAAKETELASLREFKASIDEENAKAEKLNAIRNKFVEAGLDKGDEYFTENAETFINMGEGALAFFIQEMASNLSEEARTAAASKQTTKIPALTGTDNTEDLKDPKVLGRILRESKNKK